MNVCIARQPIMAAHGELFAYELLYRDSSSTKNAFDESFDGTKATSTLVSDAITTFGLENLTNGRFAFLNFPRTLLLGDFVYLLRPDEVVIEILEDVVVDRELLEKVAEIRDRGYVLAMDDYAGYDDGREQLIDLVDIIKVDFQQISYRERKRVADRLLGKGKQILAEKVENELEYRHALRFGYTLFQGYYFSKPIMLQKKTLDVTSTTCIRMLRETRKSDPSFDELARIVEQDINMAYKLIRRMSTLEYYRNQTVRGIKTALVRMGLDEIRRWMMLLFIRENAKDHNNEIVKTALVRAVFAEKIATAVGQAALGNEAFTVGMFSMVHFITGDSIGTVLRDLSFSEAVNNALLGKEGVLTEILRFVIAYEQGDWAATESIFGDKISMDRCLAFYVDALAYADQAFV